MENYDNSVGPKQKFYDQHYPDFPKSLKKEKAGNVRILTYNVNGFKNFDANIEVLDNFKLIKKMIITHEPEVIVLQEVCVYEKFTITYIIEQFKSHGYNSYGYAPCGNNKNVTNDSKILLIMTKNNVEAIESLDISVENCVDDYKENVACNAIKIRFGKINFVSLQLDPGEKFRHLDPLSEEYETIVFNNVLKRKHQIEMVLNNFKNLAFISGDFNFGIGDDEFNYLVKEKGFDWDEIYDDTTSYNRTDFTFVKKDSNIKIVTSTILTCNYSNHLPVITELCIKDK
jgi:exonuclease III